MSETRPVERLHGIGEPIQVPEVRPIEVLVEVEAAEFVGASRIAQRDEELPDMVPVPAIAEIAGHLWS